MRGGQLVLAPEGRGGRRGGGGLARGADAVHRKYWCCSVELLWYLVAQMAVG